MQPLVGTSMKATTSSEGGHHQVCLADLVTSVAQFWSQWSLRISVIGSLSAYVLISLLSGTRRRSAASGRRWILRWAKVQVFILWAAYQAGEKAATSALDSSQSLSDSDAAEQQVIAFWGPFLLLHLAGPDNMAAYSLEDNKLSLRKVFEVIVQLLGVFCAIWNNIYLAGSWVLFAAAVIMFIVAGARYVERVCAQWRGNLDNMTEDEGEDEDIDLGCTASLDGEQLDLDDGQALLFAQDLFPIWRRALIDSSVEPGSASQRSSEKIFLLGWRSMCKVVEMELSLMYETLYTKATVAHTWPGYLIRFVSPLATATATSLFWHYMNNKEAGRHVRESYVVITYLLLGTAIAMDVVWLLRALGSTWTYHFLKTKTTTRSSWLRHKALCCGGWWRRLHRAVICLDPLRLFGVDPVSSRRWSGTIGRYNLVHECTSTRRPPWRRWLATKLGLEETRYLSELPETVTELVFQRVRRILPSTSSSSAGGDHDDGDRYTMAAITTFWGQEALRRGKEKVFGNNILPRFGHEFEQDVVAWHIATCIFLSRAKVRELAAAKSPAGTAHHVPAIEAMSEYLMFLVAERRQMLPGLVLHRLLDRTRRALEEIWDEGTTCIIAAGSKAEKLATMLRRKRRNDDGDRDGSGRRLVLDAAAIAAALTKSSMRQEGVVKMLKLIFNVWVDKLLYAGVRCSEESHARQLSNGGELTTVLWIVVQHAGPFRIGEVKPDHKNDKSPPEEKPKKPEKEDISGPTWYCPYPCYPCPCPCPCPCHQDEPYWTPMAKPSPEDEEDDPEDAKDYAMLIEYATLY